MRDSDALDNNPHVSRSALASIHSQAYGWALSRCDFDHAAAEDLMQQAYDVGGGRMIPTTSADQYAATLARWFGIPDIDLDIVAPHLDNFTQRDLGFMV